MPVKHKKGRTFNRGGTIVTHDTANATYVVVGNTSTSNVFIDGQTANVVGATISQAIFGAANGAYWTVTRGSNTVAVLTGTGNVGFSQAGLSLDNDASANIGLTLTGGTVGFIMLEIKTETEAGS